MQDDNPELRQAIDDEMKEHRKVKGVDIWTRAFAMRDLRTKLDDITRETRGQINKGRANSMAEEINFAKHINNMIHAQTETPPNKEKGFRHKVGVMGGLNNKS
jgi:hypothetical protein